MKNAFYCLLVLLIFISKPYAQHSEQTQADIDTLKERLYNTICNCAEENAKRKKRAEKVLECYQKAVPFDLSGSASNTNSKENQSQWYRLGQYWGKLAGQWFLNEVHKKLIFECQAYFKSFEQIITQAYTNNQDVAATKKQILSLNEKITEENSAKDLLLKLERGELYLKTGQYDLAIRDFDEICKKSKVVSTFNQAYILLGYGYFFQGNYLMAIDIFSNFRKSVPASIQSLTMFNTLIFIAEKYDRDSPTKLVPARPAGGVQVFQTYIQQNLRYPKAAKAMKLEGVVEIAFVIEEDGSLTNIKVVKGIGSGCDTEAIRLIKNAPKWLPSEINGVKKRFMVTIPITFKYQ